MTEQVVEVPPGEAKFQIIFEASGCVGKGEGPDALEVPEQETDES